MNVVKQCVLGLLAVATISSSALAVGSVPATKKAGTTLECRSDWHGGPGRRHGGRGHGGNTGGYTR